MFFQAIQIKIILPQQRSGLLTSQHLLKRFYDNLIDRQLLFITAIIRQMPTFGQQSAAILNNTNATPLTSIINGIYEFIQKHFVLVPDDYQPLKDNEDTNYFAGRFIKYLGKNCYLNEQLSQKSPTTLWNFLAIARRRFFRAIKPERSEYKRSYNQ